MRGNLSVRVNDGYTDRMVTSKTTGLRFRKTAPGGHHSASCTITVPRDTFQNLGPADKLYIYDSRTAATVWEGYTENPGATDGPAGQRYELSAMGGMILTQDQSTPVIFMERSLDSELWQRVDNITPGGSDSVVEQKFLLQFPSGIPVAQGSQVALRYQGFTKTGQRLASFRAVVDAAGKIDSNYAVEFVTRTDGVGGEVPARQFFTTGAATIAAALPSWPVGRNTLDIRVIKYTVGATNVADDNTWARISSLYLRPILKNGLGGDALSFGSTLYVTPHEVAQHVVGALLPASLELVQFEASTGQIDNLSYLDGATPQKILDDLTLFEPNFIWEVLETGTSGKHRFNYRAWPTTPRYEVSVKDGYNAPGGEVDLCNRVVVYYTDTTGARQSVTVTQSVPELGSRVRDADAVTLPAGMGSAANALLVGQQVLALKTADAPTAATAVVRRPIVDHLRGCMVMPWEIEPGYLVRVRETGEDLRMTEMEYADADCSATLTLGTPVLSVEQILARLG